MTQHSLKNTIVLFTGSDTRTASATFHKWVEEFGKKHGTENITEFSDVITHAAEILALLLTPSLLGGKRMVVLKDFPQKPPTTSEDGEKYAAFEEKFISLLPLIHEDVVVLMLGFSYDGRRKHTKKLLQSIDVRAFEQQQYSVDDMVSKSGMTISHSDLLYLKERLGKDPERTYLEIQKLATFADGGGVTREDIDRLIISSVEVGVFTIINYLGADNKRAAKQLQILMEQGHDPMSIIGMLVWHFERLAEVEGLLRKGNSKESIMKELGMDKSYKFDSVKKALSVFPYTRIKKAFALLVSLDRQLKNGELSFTQDNRQEVKLALIELILRL